MNKDRQLLLLAAAALRDLYVGFPFDEIAAPNGSGLDLLLKGLTGHLRGQGIDDQGALDCNLTRDIPVAQFAPELTEDEIADHLLARIESGDLSLEDIPSRMARYGLMEPSDFANEMRERIEMSREDA